MPPNRAIPRTRRTKRRARTPTSFVRVRLMPMLEAASSSSRIACQERPSRESYIRRMMKIENIPITRINQYQLR